VGVRFGGGIGSRSALFEGYWANPFPMPGMGFRLPLGVVVKKGWANRRTLSPFVGSVGCSMAVSFEDDGLIEFAEAD
jgi:hypothetical protein